jgi:uncharacterized damage-inducible protein DinB
MSDFYRRLFHYDAWATGRVMDALEQQRVCTGRLVELVAHLIIAKRLWLARIHGRDSSAICIWPKLPLPECRILRRQIEEDWGRLLIEADQRWDVRAVRYRSSSGQEYTSTITDIFLHVSHHGAYHRGQIAVLMRSQGLEPVNTDYIAYARGLSEIFDDSSLSHYDTRKNG